MPLVKLRKARSVWALEPMGRLVAAFALLFVPAGIAAGAAVENGGPGGQTVGRVGCPQCLNDGSEISRLLQRADDLYADLGARESLRELFKVLKIDPQNHEALSKISRSYIDLGDTIPESGADWQEKRLKHYRTAREYARKAVQADPDSTWGHFYVAASLGKIAVLSSIDKQVDLSREIRAAVEKAIALDPENGFAYHVYGVWHRRMAQVGQMRRVLANLILWQSVPDGSLEKSVDYLNKAIAINPRVISHHLELGRTYMALGQWQLARKALSYVQELPLQYSDDTLNKREARELLREIKDR
jgi:tetratricopeptide (TPR) repeat protein